MIHDLRFAFRQLVKSPGFSAISVLILTLAIGATTALFSLIKGAYFDSLPYPRSHDIVTLDADFSKTGKSEMPFSGREFLALKEQSHALTNVTALIGASFNLTGDGDAVRFRGLRATASLFPMLEVQPLLGRVFSEEEQTPGKERVVVISYQLWKRALGGNESVVGRELRLNDVAYTIVGVMPPRFRYGDNDLWVPLSLDLARQERTVRNIYCHARLAPGASVKSANAELATVADRFKQDLAGGSLEYAGWSITATPLIDGVVRDVKPALAILFGAVACVLLIACANISNLQLARNLVREREMAIRLALGARRADIVRQLLVESALLAAIGGIGGILLASWSLGPLVRLIPFSYIPIEADVKIDAGVLGAALGITALTAILFGLLPALRASRPAVGRSLQAGRSPAGALKHRRTQQGLVVSQIGLTFVMLIAAGLMMKSFARLQGVNPGFNPGEVLKLEVALSPIRYSTASEAILFYNNLLAKIRTIPGVKSASAVTVLPLAPFPARTAFSLEGKSQDQLGGRPLAEQRQIMPKYLTTLNISLLQGRDLDERDTRASLPSALVNEALVAKYFPDGKALGRRIRLDQSGDENQWLTIVGVVADVRQLRVNDPVMPQIYRAHAQAPDASRRMAVVLHSSLGPGGLLKSVRDVVRSQDPTVALFDAEPMPEFIARSFGGQKLATFLLGLFGALALLLTVIGLYGVMAYFVRNRTAEIGVRMALGARRSHIFQLILSQGIAMLLCGGVLGLGGALATTRVLRSLLFEVSESDLATYSLVLASLALAAFLACYFPARAAMRLNPMEALRHE